MFYLPEQSWNIQVMSYVCCPLTLPSATSTNKYQYEVVSKGWSVEKSGRSYPMQQALWWGRGYSFSVRALGHAQLGRHGGRFVNVGQRLWAILRLDIFCPVCLVAICVVVKVWGGVRERELAASSQSTRPSLQWITTTAKYISQCSPILLLATMCSYRGMKTGLHTYIKSQCQTHT